MKIKKVHDAAKAQPIDDIADRAADHQPDRDPEKAGADPPQPHDQDRDDKGGHQREDHGIEPGVAVEEAEADASVAGYDDIEKRAHLGTMTAAAGLAEMTQHGKFAELVECGR